MISIHALLAESDDVIAAMTDAQSISIHALLAESDANRDADWVRVYVFLSTLSLRRATSKRFGDALEHLHFYPRSPCGERPTKHAQATSNQPISIHALLAESDCNANYNYRSGRPISIHALLAESDGIGLVFLWWGVRFLSTLSLRRATRIIDIINNVINNFYPRSPCGERRLNLPSKPIDKNISIHALLAESDRPLR